MYPLGGRRSVDKIELRKMLITKIPGALPTRERGLIMYLAYTESNVQSLLLRECGLKNWQVYRPSARSPYRPILFWMYCLFSAIYALKYD